MNHPKQLLPFSRLYLMKKYFYLLSIILFGFQVYAQQDTAAYAAQRAKVNSLLAERSTRFGQYDESLNQRTGIFGWQTKRDIKNSNEILRQVVLTDNNIFKELKVLMDYKDLQNQQKVAVADNSQERIERYMQTIKKLQDQNAQLKEDLDQKNKGSLSNYIIAFLILVMAGGFYFFNKKLQGYEKRTV
jgi:small-conductance mechanosensitive channel